MTDFTFRNIKTEGYYNTEIQIIAISDEAREIVRDTEFTVDRITGESMVEKMKAAGLNGEKLPQITVPLISNAEEDYDDEDDWT